MLTFLLPRHWTGMKSLSLRDNHGSVGCSVFAPFCHREGSWSQVNRLKTSIVWHCDASIAGLDLISNIRIWISLSSRDMISGKRHDCWGVFFQYVWLETWNDHLSSKMACCSKAVQRTNYFSKPPVNIKLRAASQRVWSSRKHNTTTQQPTHNVLCWFFDVFNVFDVVHY